MVELDVVAEDGGLADDDAGAVVDAEAATDARGGVDVDAGAAVGVGGDHPRERAGPLGEERVRDPVCGDRVEAGVVADHLGAAMGGGVAVDDRLRVLVEAGVEVGQAGEEAARERGRAFRRVGAFTEQLGELAAQGLGLLAQGVQGREAVPGELGEREAEQVVEPGGDVAGGRAAVAGAMGGEATAEERVVDDGCRGRSGFLEGRGGRVGRGGVGHAVRVRRVRRAVCRSADVART